jgi:hypothetical protein
MSDATEDKPRVRPPSVAAAYLLERVRKMEGEEAGVIEAARVKFRARIAGLIAKAPKEVQTHYFALARAGKGEE